MLSKLLKPLKIAGLLGSITLLSACFGETVEVPPAHVGKISGKGGLQEKVISPSKTRLSNICLVCDNLVLVEAADYPKEEEMTLYMKDKLNLVFDVRGTFATSTESDDLEMIYARISPMPTRNDRVMKIDSNRIYETYGQQVVRSRVRSVMSKYTTEEVLGNHEAVSKEVSEEVRKALVGTPIKVVNFGLAGVQPPAVVKDAEEKRKRREIEIAEAEADEQVKIRKAQADLEVAKLQQAVELKQAETDVMVQMKLQEGFNQSFVMRRGLAVLQELAKSNNKVVFLPTEALSNPAVMIGAMNATVGKVNDVPATASTAQDQ